MHYTKLPFNSARLGGISLKKISFIAVLVFLAGCGGESPRGKPTSNNEPSSAGKPTSNNEPGFAVYEVMGQGKIKNPNGTLLPVDETVENAKKDYKAEMKVILKPGKNAKISDVTNIKKSLTDSGVKYGS
jgi:hypothetical protein